MFVIELTPATLVYLTKLMDASGVTVQSADVMSHAHIRQQLANPQQSDKLIEQIKQQVQQQQPLQQGGTPPMQIPPSV